MNSAASILLVEDDGNEVDVALRALRRAGLEGCVEVAKDGQEALARLGLEEEAPGVPAPLRPSAVFLDLKLPRVDGWEVLRRMRADPATADTPVVVVSSSDREDDIDRCYALGANSFLVKHFDRRGPGAYLVDAARYWIELNQPPPSRRRTDRPS